MKTTNDQATANQFKRALEVAIRKYIRGSIADGTTAMSLDCLMQCVRAPSENLEGAPKGTNARYYYAEMFREICEAKDIAAFILE